MNDSLKEHLRTQVKDAASRTSLILYAAVLAVAVIILVLAGCGSSAPAPAASPSPSPTFTMLSLVDACKALRTDMLANGGTPDKATLRRIIGHSDDSKLTTDAQNVLDTLGKDDLAVSLLLGPLSYDCRSTGVQIPQSA
jgi:hypothetical protein